VATVMDIIQQKASELSSEMGAERGVGVEGGLTIGVFIAGPIDEDYHPKVNNHHWEVATLAPVRLLGLVIDLDCIEIVDAESKRIFDGHGWLSLNTRGREHTLGVLLVATFTPPNLVVPVSVTNLGGGLGYLPVAVTFIGRNKQDHYRNVITQWHEELLKFFIGGAG